MLWKTIICMFSGELTPQSTQTFLRRKDNSVLLSKDSFSALRFLFLKGWLTGFFLGLIVFMGCSLACVQTREVTRCSPLPVVFVGIKLPEF